MTSIGRHFVCGRLDLRGERRGRNLWVWGDRYSFKAPGEETDGAWALLEMEVQPGSGTPPHIHRAEAETFYITSGRLSLWREGERVEGTPGTFVSIPRGVAHHFLNESDAPARALVLLSPAGFEQFLMRIGTEITDATPVAPSVSDEEKAAAVALAAEYQMDLVAAPAA